jgi:hypothetical protein
VSDAMKPCISFAAKLAFGIYIVAKCTRIFLEITLWSILVITMYHGPLLVLLLLAICTILEGRLMKVIVDIKP